MREEYNRYHICIKNSKISSRKLGMLKAKTKKSLRKFIKPTTLKRKIRMGMPPGNINKPLISMTTIIAIHQYLIWAPSLITLKAIHLQAHGLAKFPKKQTKEIKQTEIRQGINIILFIKKKWESTKCPFPENCNHQITITQKVYQRNRIKSSLRK